MGNLKTGSAFKHMQPRDAPALTTVSVDMVGLQETDL